MTDVGARLVDDLYAQLDLDDAWAVRRDRGFTWWGYWLAQHVVAGPPAPNGACAIRIWTDLVRDVDPHRDPARALAAANADATLSALLWRPDARAVVACCTATVDERNFDALSTVLATAAALQVADAHNRAQSLAQACGGAAAVSHHPTSGQRPDPASHFEGDLIEALDDYLAGRRLHGSADRWDATCEVPYTGNRPAKMLAEMGRRGEIETALVQIYTDTAHGQVGNGAILTVKLPASPEPQRVLEWSNWLNAAESNGDSRTPLLGAWCPDPDAEHGRTLIFRSFLPNVIAAPGELETQIGYQMTRALFAAQHVGA
jgi:hypothetical protein